MATQTITTTSFLQSLPRQNHGGGITAQYFELVTGGTAIGGDADRVLLCKLPNQARILDVDLIVTTGATSLSTRVIFGVADTSGTWSAVTTIRATMSGATTLRHTGLPAYPKVSITDTNAVQYAALILETSGATQTTATACSGYVIYETFGS
jgi:hypothetical protein